MVASLWSALPMVERAKYERKAEQNLQHLKNVQNLDCQNFGREVEEESRSSQCRVEKIDQGGVGENYRKATTPATPLPVLSPDTSPSASSPAPSSSPATSHAPASSRAPASSTAPPPPPATYSPAEEKSLDLIGDSQPYRIFFSELRQVLGS